MEPVESFARRHEPAPASVQFLTQDTKTDSRAEPYDSETCQLSGGMNLREMEDLSTNKHILGRSLRRRINQTMECWPLGRPHGASFAAGLLANIPVEADGEAQR